VTQHPQASKRQAAFIAHDLRDGGPAVAPSYMDPDVLLALIHAFPGLETAQISERTLTETVFVNF
jgi:hypothetical protein